MRRAVASLVAIALALFCCAFAMRVPTLAADDAFVASVEMPEVRPSLLLRANAVTGSGLGAPSSTLNARVLSYLHDWVGLFAMGQSLAAGYQGNPPVNTTQVGNSIQLYNDAGYPQDAADPTWMVKPLVAPERADEFTTNQLAIYPKNIGGETSDVCLINSIDLLATAAGYSGFTLAASNPSQSGMAYAFICFGGINNPAASDVQAIEAAVYKRLAGSTPFTVLAIALNHGESDSNHVSPAYYNSLTTWWSDYQSHIKVGVTGQANAIPFIITQQIAWPPPVGLSSTGENASALDVYQFCQDNPTKCILVGSKAAGHYAGDHLHEVQHSYCNQGESEAHALWTWMNTGAWSPIWPLTVKLVGNVVTLTVNVPYGPLQFDGTLTGPHLAGAYWGDNGTGFGGAGHTGWTAGKGFECWSGGTLGTAIGITALSITSNPSGPNVTATIQVTCASTPDTIAYAHTADDFNGGAGDALGGWGDGNPIKIGNPILDSDPYTGLITHDALPNRMVTFRCASLSGTASPCHE